MARRPHSSFYNVNTGVLTACSDTVLGYGRGCNNCNSNTCLSVDAGFVLLPRTSTTSGSTAGRRRQSMSQDGRVEPHKLHFFIIENAFRLRSSYKSSRVPLQPLLLSAIRSIARLPVPVRVAGHARLPPSAPESHPS
jgi:hypothetical protein